MAELRLPRRVVVVGVTGSGKTAFAARIAAIIAAPHTELDSLYHEANWRPAAIDVFRERVRAATAGGTWVVDGGYASHVRDIAWARADTLVWLDYGLPLILARLFRRTLRRRIRNEELWNGNRESLRTHFMSKDSLFLWALQTHKKHRRAYPEYFANPELAHLRIVRLTSARAAEAYVRSLEHARRR